MKRIAFFLIASIFLFACSEQKSKLLDNGCRVSGTITNAAGNNIVINRVTGDRNNPLIPIDTVKISESGNFSIELSSIVTGFYYMTTGNNSITLVLHKGDDVKISGDNQNLSTAYTVEGSVDSQTILDFNNEYYKILRIKDSITGLLAQVSTDEQKDSIEKIYNPIFVSALEDMKTKIKKNVDTNPELFSNIYVVSLGFRGATLLNPKTDFEYFKKVATSLSAKYPESENVKEFVANVAQVEQSMSIPQGIEIGETAPEINYPTPDGTKLALSSLKGQYVLLDFWASWCGPCRKENPNLVQNYKKYKAKGFTIFQVSLDQTDAAWKDAIQKDNLSAWKHVSDLKGWESEPAKLYGIRSIPANLLLDKEGKIIARDLRGEDLGTKLEEIFGGTK